MAVVLPVIPNVECCERHNAFNVTLHRLDEGLELAVCNRCGKGQVQDLSASTKLADSMKRMDKAVKSLSESVKKLNASIEKLAGFAK